jgi:hypothetical protein
MADAALYLNEEIQAEALTRNVGAFSRFLEVAAPRKRARQNWSSAKKERKQKGLKKIDFVPQILF